LETVAIREINIWPEMMGERRKEEEGTRVNVDGIRAAPAPTLHRA
jgi:hypothetical protein